MKILIVAEHASAAYGGEAALPLHYFRVLRRRGHDVWLLVHERTRDELVNVFGDDPRMIFMPDTAGVVALWHMSKLLPQRLSDFTTSYLQRVMTQRRQHKVARDLVRAEQIDIVHQPIPVSPREPSLLYGLGAAVVMGPMNGNMDFPPKFRAGRSSRLTNFVIMMGRAAANAMNWFFPGKRQAAAILVANERTRRALPAGISGRVMTLVENGVDLSVWKSELGGSHDSSAHTRFVFLGRLVDWKAVDLLLAAFTSASERSSMSLLIIGDGDQRQKLEAQASALGILSADEAPGTVSFTGYLSQVECARRLCERDALVLPSLYECGGAVVLEAMAMERPVIATAWGGPMDYLDASCGILVEPETPEKFVDAIADAMVKLASSPELRRELGKAGARKIVSDFDWEKKVDTMLAIYGQAISDHKLPRTSKRSASG